MKRKPRLSFWQIWNMSFGFFGIQFGFALQNANVSRIFETLGAKVEDIPILWIAAPVTGLIMQPIIGHMSDNTWNRLGRRRPYFLTGAILASLALLVMPNSPALWVAAGMLWIMDASINISMEPFRASGAGQIHQPEGDPHDCADRGGCGTDIHISDRQSPPAGVSDAWGGTGMGKYPCHALCHTYRVAARK